MRILIDGRMLCRPKSGIGYYLENLLSALSEIDRSNEYTVAYLPSRSPDVVHTPASPNFHSTVLRMPNRLSTRLFRDSSSPYRTMRNFSRRFDIVHEPAFEPLPYAPRSVVTIHDMIFFRLADHFDPKFAERYQRRVRDSVANASQVIAVSESTRRDIIEILQVAPDKVHAIPLGVRPEEFQIQGSDSERRATLKQMGITHPYLLSIGDLYRRKNNITLVRAFARLPEALQQSVQLVIAGAAKEPEVLNELQTEINLRGLQGKVILLGYVENTLRRLLLSQSTALCYPSTYEGFGLPPLEAMACGVPVICAENTSIPEVVGNAALLIADYTNPDAWTVSIQRLLTGPDLRSKLITAGQLHIQAFTWKATARATLSVYSRAVDSLSQIRPF